MEYYIANCHICGSPIYGVLHSLYKPGYLKPTCEHKPFGASIAPVITYNSNCTSPLNEHDTTKNVELLPPMMFEGYKEDFDEKIVGRPNIFYDEAGEIKKRDPRPVPVLTYLENLILRMIAEGKEPYDIACACAVAVEYIHEKIQGIAQKMGIENWDGLKELGQELIQKESI